MFTLLVFFMRLTFIPSFQSSSLPWEDAGQWPQEPDCGPDKNHGQATGRVQERGKTQADQRGHSIWLSSGRQAWQKYFASLKLTFL